MNSPQLTSSVAEAVRRIAPLWPLDHFVAVNPFVGLVDRPFADACRLLERTTGAAPLLAPAEYLALYDAGQITDADLAAVAPSGLHPAALHAALARGRGHPARLLLPSEHADHALGRAHWAPFIVQEVARWCATYYDDNQTTWRCPWRGAGLYAGWRESARLDRNPEVFGCRGFRAFVKELPADATAAIESMVAQLGLESSACADVFHAALATVSGWAGYTRYLAHEDGLRGRKNTATAELLGIRLAYEAALCASGRLTPAAVSAWRTHVRETFAAATHAGPDVRVVWQLAYERGLQLELARQLGAGAGGQGELAGRPLAQAVFCIDVRSESLRRHIETAAPEIQTLGFAGFFGFALEHKEDGGSGATARCPVLVAPQLPTAVEGQGGDATPSRDVSGAWKAFQNSAASTFSFVEATGLGFAPALMQAARPRATPQCNRANPEIDLSPSAQEKLAVVAAGALRGMSLTQGLARLVLFCGHGSRSTNNPHASSLGCGACGGYAGDVNARIAARVFNHPGIRARLARAGIRIPEDTVFVAGLHDTMTDEVTLLDGHLVPASHDRELQRLREALTTAGETARRHRAGSVGLPAGASREAFAARAADPAQVRPEWALANNAAYVVAPRELTRGLDLRGRVFLNEYRADEDPDGRVLEGILAAPVVVGGWINLQYYASRVDPARYSAGSKLLHDVVGGLGVVEGNLTDIRTGLPWQSLHDGTRFRHEPRRLSVFVAASRSRIDGILQRQPGVRQLFDHGWLHLFAIEDEGTHQYAGGRWTLVESGSVAASAAAA